MFSDYMRPAVRLAALMRLAVTYVWTHDSIGTGEDGPAHQPVEHLAALRAVPQLDVVRPADANETVIAWRTVVERGDRPAGVLLSRQNPPVFDRRRTMSAEGTARGGYVLVESTGLAPRLILIGTGSEVRLAVRAAGVLEAEGIPARVVSMPCVAWFEEQEEAYQRHVLPADIRAQVSVGFTRVALGVHWCSDVLGGWLLGLAVVAATAWSFQTWRAEVGRGHTAVADGLEPEITHDAPEDDAAQP